MTKAQREKETQQKPQTDAGGDSQQPAAAESAVIKELREALGEDCVMTGAAVAERQAGIWRSDTIQAKALLRPRLTEQVSQALAICNSHGQSVVAHGGLTGLVESAITSPDDVALSLERLNTIEEINPVDRTMTVQSGVILQTLQEAADEHDLMFPLDLGGRGSATIGGNISTNAGGNRVIRYGMTRDMVLGLEAVLADGTVVSSMNQMIKNNAGYDLKAAVHRHRRKPWRRDARSAAAAARKSSTQPTAVRRGRFSSTSLLRFLKHVDRRRWAWLRFPHVRSHVAQLLFDLVTTPPAGEECASALRSGHIPYYVLVEAMGAAECLRSRRRTCPGCAGSPG